MNQDHAFSDERSGCLPYEDDTFPSNLAWTQNQPQSTLRYLEQNHSLPSPDYALCLQPTWALNGFNPNMPSTSTQIGINSTTGWVKDDASPVGAKSTTNYSWMDFENSGLNGHQQGHFSASVVEPLKEAICGDSPADDCTSRSRRSKPNANGTGPLKCGWKDCTNPRLFSRHTSLWRHIKDKHLFPDAFKCSFPQCGKSFGGLDKLQEHLRSAHADAEGQKGKCCRSCHA